MKTVHALAASAAILGLAGSASAIDPYISELFWNPGGADQGYERIELAGDPGASLAGYWLIDIDGDGPAGGAIDHIIDLGSYTFGTNGLLLIADDGVLQLDPPPAAGTSVVVVNFTPDLENGSNTYVLFKGANAFTVGQDLDPEADGTLAPGSFAGLTVVDAVGSIENDGSPADDWEFCNDPEINVPGGSLGLLLDTLGNPYTPSAFLRVRTADCAGPSIWAGGAALGTAAGPYSWDVTRTFGFEEAGLDPLVVIPALGVENACDLGGTACYPDCDVSGTLNIDDFICFQTFFAIGDVYADCDLSGNLNIDDFICFQTFYAIGC